MVAVEANLEVDTGWPLRLYVPLDGLLAHSAPAAEAAGEIVFASPKRSLQIMVLGHRYCD